MSDLEVIILAQGNQSRLGRECGPKQLLGLPACRHTPIVVRTMAQIRGILLDQAAESQCVDRSLRIRDAYSSTVLITWPAVISQFQDTSIGSHFPREVKLVTLPDPGNSSLKGIARYLEGKPVMRRVVLLGDVVYSWACLTEILSKSDDDWGFVGTPDLSSSSGELWGVSWGESAHDDMLIGLREALLRHSPFDEYQPGQLRRWISGRIGHRGSLESHVDLLRTYGHYSDISDYTRDIDVPSHLMLLPMLSEKAAADDALHGMHWD